MRNLFERSNLRNSRIGGATKAKANGTEIPLSVDLIILFALVLVGTLRNLLEFAAYFA